MSLTGQVAIITGAGSGIGASVARALAGEGMRLVLNGRRAEPVEALAEELGDALALPGDVVDPATAPRLVERALAEFGRLDVAINNAGMIALGPIESLDLERMAAMVRVNVEAAFRFIYTVLRHFKAEDRGHLVNTSSILGTTVRAHAGAYAGTKHALEALTHSLRLELARANVRLTNIQPGLVLTGLHRHMERHPKETLGIDQPLSPDDVARAVLYVLREPANVRVNSIQVMPRGQEL
jgi:NADP-dependent 3-hydroxy acid dehydrogenase YdfG